MLRKGFGRTIATALADPRYRDARMSSSASNSEGTKSELVTTHPEDELRSFKTVVTRIGQSRSSSQSLFSSRCRLRLRRVGRLASEAYARIRRRPVLVHRTRRGVKPRSTGQEVKRWKRPGRGPSVVLSIGASWRGQ